MPSLCLRGGRIVDPANGINDQVGDLWIDGGRVVAPPDDPGAKADRTIDARGYVVMPGGVDVHCHIAGPKVNAARLLRPEERSVPAVLPRSELTRSGTLGSVPSTFATGLSYAALGYTAAIDAAIAPLGARQANLEMQDTPLLDKGFLVLLANNHYVMDCLSAGDHDRLRSFVAWMLRATRGFGVKAVNPGGVEQWKQGGARIATLDDRVDGFGVTPRQILDGLARAVDELGLPHPLHVHGLNLGLPGNAATTLELMQALDGHRAHLAHIQFHSYGGSLDDLTSFGGEVGPLVDYFNDHPDLTADVGQVLHGETTSMTADGGVGAYLHRVTGRKWVSHDLEMETGCGIVPITYDDRNRVHSLQWAIGLEWFLRANDPWRLALSTDHPNGGSFLAYPKLIALLMDRNRRDEALARLPRSVRAHSGLGDLTREYSLSEIAIITRSGPARMLGLTDRGHLGAGALADVTVYAPDDDLERMFAAPRLVLKSGEIVFDDGECRDCPGGAMLRSSPGFDSEIEADIAAYFDRYSTVRWRNFVLEDPA